MKSLILLCFTLLLTSFYFPAKGPYNPQIAEIQSYNLNNVDTLLDIGCQDGTYSKEVARFYPKLFLILEDLNEYQLCREGGVHCTAKNTATEVKKKFRNSRKYPNIASRYQFIAGTKDSIPLVTSSYSRILCRRSLHEFEKLDPMVNELYRVLRPNGVLTISEVEPTVKIQTDVFCNKKYLSQKDVLEIMKRFKLISIKTIDYKVGNIVTYNFTKP